jgi:hypothetical protein
VTGSVVGGFDGDRRNAFTTLAQRVEARRRACVSGFGEARRPCSIPVPDFSILSVSSP